MEHREYQFWFITGSQFLYGPETLAQVEKNSQEIITHLNQSGALPWKLVNKGVMKTAEEITSVIKEANYEDQCIGIITFMHTFSPSKMWINGFRQLQKPYLHFHTQYNVEIPNEGIDMDYMNLHQSAHGDREHGFIAARMSIPRKVVVGHWQQEDVQEKITKWMRAAVGVAVSKTLKVMRFGDNMREVAVTEGDKVEVQMKLGWQVNTWPVGLLVETMNQITDEEINGLMDDYQEKYTIGTENIDAIRYQARAELGIQKLMDKEQCQAYTNTFEDLYGMEQLPGLASQHLMAKGYGYGGEGDWKVSAMTHIIKEMAKGLEAGTSFMEDYTYDFLNGVILGAHMLEVCPTLAADKPRIEVHPLGIGNRKPPARLVYEGKAGSAIVASLVDMGGRLRLIVQDVECVKPMKSMPNLPVARVMWKPMPDLSTGAHAWILAGGAHHSVLSYDIDGDVMRDFARIMDIEFVHIHKNIDINEFEQQLAQSNFYWNRKE